MLTFYSSQHHGHAPKNDYLHGRIIPYFESPSRIEVIKSSLEDAGLITIIEPELAVTIDVLSKVHAYDMLSGLQQFSQNAHDFAVGELAVYAIETTDDEYFYQAVFPRGITNTETNAIQKHHLYGFDYAAPIGKNSWNAALHSANLAYMGAKSLVDGEKQAYVLCRPPGHHAGREYVGGYCYINNAAVAANTLKSLDKVAILDIDYHHGNGTQDIFWKDPNVLFVSIHANPKIDYPPFSGFSHETGEKNTIFNIPLAHGTNGTRYLDALNRALTRISDFRPSALVVSLGFDTFEGDSMCDFQLDVGSYRKLGQKIGSLGLPTLYVQEGGYHNSLGEVAISFFRGVLE